MHVRARARAHTHTHTHTHAQAFSGKVTPSMEAGEHPPQPTFTGSFTRRSNCRGAAGPASCGRGQVAKGVVGSDGRGGGRVPGVRREENGPASLALNGQAPGPKPQVLQGEFLSSFSSRFIISLLRPALWENRPSDANIKLLQSSQGRVLNSNGV